MRIWYRNMAKEQSQRDRKTTKKKRKEKDPFNIPSPVIARAQSAWGPCAGDEHAPCGPSRRLRSR